MRTIIHFPLISLIIILTSCTNGNKIDDLDRVYPLDIYDESGVVFSFDDGIRIKFGDSIPMIPKENAGLIDSLASYLNENDFNLLTVSGFFEQTENGNNKKVWSGTYGKSRAQYIKSLIVEKGIPESRIITETIAQNLIFDNENIHYGGFDFFFRKAKEKSSQSLVKHLYFPSGKSNFYSDDNLTSYTGNLIAFLEEFPNKLIKIVGHTDNVETTESLDILGLSRAKTVKEFLIKNGVNEDKITIASRGSTEPISSNSTEGGRKKNRRIEVRIY